MSPHLDACIVSSPLAVSTKWRQRLPRSHREAHFQADVALGHNARFAVGELAGVCGGALSPRCLDLLEVAAAVYLTDQMVRRPTALAGSRRLALHIQVRDPDLWESVREEVEGALLFLTRDAWSLGFHPRKENREWERRVATGRPRRLSDPDSIALFSGGLDSLAGSLVLHQQSRRPVLLAHSRVWKSRQRAVHGKIQPITEQELLQFDIGFDNRGVDPENRLSRRETSQRARVFLYLATAAALALDLEIGLIFLCENGPLACAVPPQPHLIPTRHAHPHFLSLLERVFSRVLEREIRLHNPFLFLTKGQELEAIAEPLRHGLEEALTLTVSCWQFFSRLLGLKPPNLSCGACVPCLVRRAALKSAGLEAHDGPFWVKLEEPLARLADKFEQMGLGRSQAQDGEMRIRQAWMAFHRFAATLDQLRDDRGFFQLPEAAELLRRPGIRELEPEWRTRVPQMYREFVQEFRICFPLP